MSEGGDPVRGAALMLLLSVVGGLAGAFLLRLFLGGIYLPVVMPGLIGWGLGMGLAFIHLRYGVGRRWPGVTAAVFGAVLAYATYHVLAYLTITGFLADHVVTGVERAAGDPVAGVQAWYEESTGQTGWLAFLAFTAQGEAADLSPLGLFGRLQPGLGGTLIGIAADALAIVGAAVGMLLRVVRREEQAAAEVAAAEAAAATAAGASGAGWADSGRRERRVIARPDTATLIEAMRLVDAGDPEAAGRALAGGGGGDHAVALIFDPENHTAYVLEILDVAADGSETVRTRRELSGWDGQALWDELRMRAGAGEL